MKGPLGLAFTSGKTQVWVTPRQIKQAIMWLVEARLLSREWQAAVQYAMPAVQGLAEELRQSIETAVARGMSHGGAPSGRCGLWRRTWEHMGTDGATC